MPKLIARSRTKAPSLRRRTTSAPNPDAAPVPRRLTVLRATICALVIAIAAVNGGVANAVTGYSISSGAWNVRSCPATCDVVGGTVSGSLPDLVCQTAGPSVTVSGFGTSTIYDLVRTPAGVLGYISDLGVLQTPYAQFSPNLPRCSAGAGPATEAATHWGYGWIVTCSGSVLFGRVWACWKQVVVQLFLPDAAS